jgi:hypothetical protein
MLLASLGASAVVACGDATGAAATTLHIDPPTSGDTSCVGVAGFEVIVVPTGHAAQTTKLVGPAPILDTSKCAIPRSFTIEDLEVEAPIAVTVHGYDGSGSAARVSGTQTIKSLHEGSVRLPLKPASALPPLLVFYRNPLLEGVFLADVTTMTIATQMGSKTLLTVSHSGADVFFDPEPGAYGIPELDADGAASGTVLNVNFTAQGGRMIKQSRFTLEWNGTYYTPK